MLITALSVAQPQRHASQCGKPLSTTRSTGTIHKCTNSMTLSELEYLIELVEIDLAKWRSKVAPDQDIAESYDEKIQDIERTSYNLRCEYEVQWSEGCGYPDYGDLLEQIEARVKRRKVAVVKLSG